MKKAPSKETRVAEWFAARGYQTHMYKPAKTPVYRYGRVAFYITHSNDLMGCIDGTGMLEDESAPEELNDSDLPWQPDDWFAWEHWQVCTPAGAYKHKRKIEEQHWPLRQLNLSFRVTLWVYRGNECRVLQWFGGRDWREWEHHIEV